MIILIPTNQRLKRTSHYLLLMDAKKAAIELIRRFRLEIIKGIQAR